MAATAAAAAAAAGAPKKEWIHTWVQKIIQAIQTDENKKMLQVFLVDPVLNHVLERLFPYVLILCVLFVVLTVMISITMLLVFTRLPGVLRASTEVL